MLHGWQKQLGKDNVEIICLNTRWEVIGALQAQILILEDLTALEIQTEPSTV